MPVFEEAFRVNAPPEALWDFLLDPARLASCIPGCERLDVEDERAWRLRLAITVGFLHTIQDVRVTITEAERPRHLVSVGHGEDPRLGSRVDIRITLDLVPDGAETLVRYRNEVKVLGRLGSVGDAVMKARAGQLAGEFAARVRAAIEAGR